MRVIVTAAEAEISDSHDIIDGVIMRDSENRSWFVVIEASGDGSNYDVLGKEVIE